MGTGQGKYPWHKGKLCFLLPFVKGSCVSLLVRDCIRQWLPRDFCVVSKTTARGTKLHSAACPKRVSRHSGPRTRTRERGLCRISFGQQKWSQRACLGHPNSCSALFEFKEDRVGEKYRLVLLIRTLARCKSCKVLAFLLPLPRFASYSLQSTSGCHFQFLVIHINVPW